MRRHIATALLLPLLLLGVSGLAGAADNDAKSTREREMLRRAQDALRQSQQENGSLAQGKAESEQKLQAANKQLEAARNASKSEQSAVRAKLKAATDAQAEVARQLEESRRQIAQLTVQQKETATTLSARESDVKRLQADLDGAKAAGASCEAKNLKLYEYSQQLVQAYDRKGVWAAMSQKEPVLGLGAVQKENLLQEYQQKLDAQRLQSSAQPAAAPLKR